MNFQLMSKIATDINMTFLLTMQPGKAFIVPSDVIGQASAILCGVLITFATYWLFFPTAQDVNRDRIVRHIASATDAVSQTNDKQTKMRKHRQLREACIEMLFWFMSAEREVLLARECFYPSRILLVSLPCCDRQSKMFIDDVRDDESLRRTSEKLRRCTNNFPHETNRRVL